MPIELRVVKGNIMDTQNIGHGQGRMYQRHEVRDNRDWRVLSRTEDGLENGPLVSHPVDSKHVVEVRGSNGIGIFLNERAILDLRRGLVNALRRIDRGSEDFHFSLGCGLIEMKDSTSGVTVMIYGATKDYKVETTSFDDIDSVEFLFYALLQI
jgi:hypothetical protein